MIPEAGEATIEEVLTLAATGGGVGDAVGVLEGVGVEVGVLDGVGVPSGLGVAVGVLEGSGVKVGVAEGVGVTVGVLEGVANGIGLGSTEGWTLTPEGINGGVTLLLVAKRS